MITLKKDLCDFELQDYINLLKINKKGDRSEIIDYFDHIDNEFYNTYIDDLNYTLRYWNIKTFSELLDRDRYCNIIRDYFNLDSIKIYITGILESSDYTSLCIDSEYIESIISDSDKLSQYIINSFTSAYCLIGGEHLYKNIQDIFTCSEIIKSVQNYLDFDNYVFTDSDIAQHLTGYLMCV